MNDRCIATFFRKIFDCSLWSKRHSVRAGFRSHISQHTRTFADTCRLIPLKFAEDVQRLCKRQISIGTLHSLKLILARLPSTLRRWTVRNRWLNEEIFAARPPPAVADSKELIVKSFKNCDLTLALDGLCGNGLTSYSSNLPSEKKKLSESIL